jgi:hypothetical protein
MTESEKLDAGVDAQPTDPSENNLLDVAAARSAALAEAASKAVRVDGHEQIANGQTSSWVTLDFATPEEMQNFFYLVSALVAAPRPPIGPLRRPIDCSHSDRSVARRLPHPVSRSPSSAVSSVTAGGRFRPPLALEYSHQPATTSLSAPHEKFFRSDLSAQRELTTIASANCRYYVR